MEVLKDHGYSVVHVNPMAKEADDKLVMSGELKVLIKDVLDIVPSPFKDAVSLIDFAVELLYTAVRRGIGRKIALLADDVFQAIGLDKAEQLVKSFLNMIEHPSINYEKIVVLVTSSEGVTRERVGRHNWAVFKTMWNMNKEGFRQIYSQLSSVGMGFEEAWRLMGGNPRYLEELVKANWSPEYVVDDIVVKRGLVRFTASLRDSERGVLKETLDDPDALMANIRHANRLVNRLIEMNMIMEVPYTRDPYLWIDEPPPEKDPELGIGKYFAWQTPIHREAVRKALEAN